MGLGEEEPFIHVTGFPLTKSGGHPSQLFWNDSASLQSAMDFSAMAMLEGHSVSLPFDLLSLEQLLKNQELTRGIKNSLVLVPQKD